MVANLIFNLAPQGNAKEDPSLHRLKYGCLKAVTFSSVTSLSNCPKEDYLSDRLTLTQKLWTCMLQVSFPSQVQKSPGVGHMVCDDLGLKKENNFKLSFKSARFKYRKFHAFL